MLHYLWFQQDATERRRTGQLIQLLTRVLRHNLRNDMNGINGWATTVLDSEDAAVRKAAARIERVSEDLMALSEHARELEHLARRDLGPKRLDPTELVRVVVETHQHSWPEGVLDVAIRTNRHICAGAELEDALLELLENAVKHSDELVSRVDLVVRDDEDWVEIVVVDDGPGIDETETRVITAGEETALEHAPGWDSGSSTGSPHATAGPFKSRHGATTRRTEPRPLFDCRR